MAYKDPEVRRKKQAEWRDKNREHMREYDKKHHAANRQKEQERYATWVLLPGNRERKRVYNREYDRTLRQNTRDKIFDLLGSVCVRCGFSDRRALQVDHINGGGERDRREAGTLQNYYRKVIEVGRAEYQILCANCNQIKRIEKREHRRC